jgi:glycosyltransferase involved in cell wall biosynthesis
MSEEKFSILMANYNNSRFIKEAIESVLRQTYDNWELVIVDDGSDDDSIEIIKKYSEDQRIKLFIHGRHLGCGATKRDCADYATGEFCAILDSDDALEKTALEIFQKTFFENPDSGFVYSTNFECDENLNIIKISKWVGETDKTNLFQYKVSALRAFRKSVYLMTPGIDPSLAGAVDRDLVYKMEEVTKLIFINKPLYYYRKHKNGISFADNSDKAEKGKISCTITAYNAYKRRLSTDIPNLDRTQMSSELLSVVPSAVKLKDWKELKFLLSQAIKLDSLNLKGYFILFFRLIKFPFSRIFLKIKNHG